MTTDVKRLYEPLTEQTAIELAKEIGLFNPLAELGSVEIGDGNLNYVFRISDAANGKSIIIKQALPYAKIVGESMPLTLERAIIEAKVLKKHGEFVPSLVPEVYLSDEDLALTVMEDLSHLTVARQGLIKGESYPILSRDIAEYLAKTLFYTSDYALHPFEKKKLVAEFSNPELCKITEDLVFTDPFFDYESNDYEPELKEKVLEIWSNEELKLEAAKLKFRFMTEAQALLHGDLHTGSIFASETETKVIDPEFGFFGPIGFDIGQFLANLLVQAITREEAGRQVILDHIEQTWNVFSSTFASLLKNEGKDPYVKLESYQNHILDNIFRDTLGFAGCELIRRTIGLAHVKDLDCIENKDKRIQFKKEALALGEALILKRQELKTVAETLQILESSRR